MAPTPLAPRLVDKSLAALGWYRSKRVVHQARRLAAWVASPERWPEPQLAALGGTELCLGTLSVAVGRADPDADPVLEAGKLHNVRLAAPAFDGLLVTPERPLSFWRTVGRLSPSAGYRHGLALSGGCLTPSVGGGICLLANALFALAARQGWHILERHGHTLEAVPPEPDTLWGMDATVAWPDVDLVVAPREGPVRLGARVAGDMLRLSVHAARPARTRAELRAEDDRVEETSEGRFRVNRVVRRVVDLRDGSELDERTIATNRRRLMHAHERRRTCLSCGETACHARVEVPRAERETTWGSHAAGGGR
ncbi:VanW family protein [Myxococcaceae bacterium JPH2]|nr:VanW family protein [Myxococcaceae bacterium JPH2]